MIQENTIWAVMPLVQKLAKSNLTLLPIGETPLTSLMHACYMPQPGTAGTRSLDPAAATAGGTAVDPAGYRALLEGSAFRSPDGVVQHDVAMDELRPVIVRVVGQNLDVARNQVNPLVKQVVADVQARIADAQKQATQRLAIQPDFFAPIWDSPVVDGMVARYTETAINNIKVNLVIPFPADLFEATRSGATRFDNEVKAFIESLPPEVISSAWEKAFGSAEGAYSSTDLFSPYRNRDELLLIHLFARRMLQQPPEGVSMDLSQFRDYMSGMVEQSGRGVARVLEKRNVDLQRKNLIISYPSIPYEMLTPGVDSVIVVNGTIYNQWLEAGGKPEALMGSFLTDKLRGYDALLENTPKLAQVWAREERVLGVKVRSDVYTHSIYALRAGLSTAINAIPEDQLVVSRNVMHERLRDALGMVTSKKLENLYGVIRLLVCRVIYPHTDALEILTTMDEVAEANPLLDIREVALLATIDIVAGWMCKLFKVETAN